MRTKKFLMFMSLLMMGGCLPVMSLNSIYTDKDIVFAEKLLGTWLQDSNEPEHTWIFEKNEKPENSYKLTFIDADNNKGLFKVYLVKLGNDLFMDVSPLTFPNLPSEPNEPEPKWTFNEPFFQPLHTFMKVELADEELNLQLAMEENIKKLFKENPQAIEYQVIDNRILITSQTKQMQQFIEKYSDNENLFADAISLVKNNSADETSKNRNTPQEK